MSVVRSHAAGTGAEVETEVVRAMMLLRLATMATGGTGVRPETAATYAELLNACQGALGCKTPTPSVARRQSTGEPATPLPTP
jgi:hypothetical protein